MNGAREISVAFFDGSTAGATVVGSDVARDLAVLHVDRTGLQPLPFGSSGELRVGEAVLVVGNALALKGGPTASLGIVSAKGRSIATTDGTTYTGLVQTDAAMNAGDSGGPLVNARGLIVGINTGVISAAENVGFAIAIDDAAPILERLSAGG